VEAAFGMDTVSRDQIRSGCLIARISSTGADTAFGIRPGIAYVWADSTNPFSATIVPDDGSTGFTYNLGIEPEPPVAATAPAKHICSECGRTDWCVYAQDGVRLPEAMFGG
jgi:hypothetical protein